MAQFNRSRHFLRPFPGKDSVAKDDRAVRCPYEALSDVVKIQGKAMGHEHTVSQFLSIVRGLLAPCCLVYSCKMSVRKSAEVINCLATLLHAKVTAPRRTLPRGSYSSASRTREHFWHCISFNFKLRPNVGKRRVNYSKRADEVVTWRWLSRGTK